MANTYRRPPFVALPKRVLLGALKVERVMVADHYGKGRLTVAKHRQEGTQLKSNRVVRLPYIAVTELQVNLCGVEVRMAQQQRANAARQDMFMGT
jgi:hypothetical protein